MAESALTAKSKAFSLEVIRLCRGCARQNVRAHLSISFCAPVRASGQMFAKHFTHRGWCATGCYGQIVRIFFAEMIFWVPTTGCRSKCACAFPNRPMAYSTLCGFGTPGRATANARICGSPHMRRPTLRSSC